jgi:hypothetical protein
MEAMVLPALERGGYEYFRQIDIGERLGGGKLWLTLWPTIRPAGAT